MTFPSLKKLFFAMASVVFSDNFTYFFHGNFFFLTWQIYLCYHGNIVPLNDKKIWKKFLLICHGNFYYIDMANLIIMPCQFLFNLLFSVRFLLFLPWQILPFSHGKITYIATVIFSFCIHVNIIASGNFFHGKLTFMGRCQFTLISLHFLLCI